MNHIIFRLRMISTKDEKAFKYSIQYFCAPHVFFISTFSSLPVDAVIILADGVRKHYAACTGNEIEHTTYWKESLLRESWFSGHSIGWIIMDNQSSMY